MTIHKGYIVNITLLADGTKNPGGNYIYKRTPCAPAKTINGTIELKMEMTMLNKIKFYYYLVIAWIRFKCNERSK